MICVDVDDDNNCTMQGIPYIDVDVDDDDEGLVTNALNPFLQIGSIASPYIQ